MLRCLVLFQADALFVGVAFELDHELHLAFLLLEPAILHLRVHSPLFYLVRILIEGMVQVYDHKLVCPPGKQELLLAVFIFDDISLVAKSHLDHFLLEAHVCRFFQRSLAL